ncbi:hypothetical protein TCON_1440 [Astathelohania contejeani]|uniref:GRAM domain-containing protein n=1 Tax=Astathelohania contejeani TaxID=164912 RepID=A0ABQ7HYV5_9MICR|nr:hypothetical protein TCON_1440 [Thelohania contejeani]
MNNINFRKKKITCINNTVFTDNQTPLPVTDDEFIAYHNPETHFYMQLGNGAPATTVRFKSHSGDIYITNYRVIYKPKISTNLFTSFFITLDKILTVSRFDSFDVIIEDEISGRIFLQFDNSHAEMFFTVLEKMLLDHSSNVRYITSNTSDEHLPFYCEKSYYQ